MPSLIEREGGDDGNCQECGTRPAIGPCAACEAMICGDCGVMSRDPTGDRVICLSCARLVADVGARPRRRPARVPIAVFVLAVIGAGIAAALIGAN